MTFLTDEAGIETSEPREGIELRTTLVQWRMATGTRNLTIDGKTYTAGAAQRDEVKIAASDIDLVITLPAAHPIVAKWMAATGGIDVDVTVWRLQAGGAVEQLWIGSVSDIALDGHLANLRVPSRIGQDIDRMVPTVSSGRSCPHVLYDRACRVDPGAALYFRSTTVVALDGRTVTVDIALDAQWSQGGELVHAASGERMTIQDQTSMVDLAGPHAVITMQFPIAGMAIGDAITIYAGCDHTVATCRGKFSNVVNYGGFPSAPPRNPFKADGPGILVT